MKKITYLLLISLLSLLCACSNKEEASSDKPLVYTSFFPINDMAKMIAGDTLNIQSFMPEDKEPHLWEPSPKDMKKLSKADLLIVNGANMEPWIETVKENLPNLDILMLSDSVELITYKGAAAIGDFQYLANLKLDKTTHGIEFGHTHEDVMRIAFFKNEGQDVGELIKKGKEIMQQKGELIPQKHTIDVEEGKVYGLEMAHETGNIYYNVPEEGDWIFVCDRVSEDLLPYYLVNSKGEKLEDENKLESLMEGSSSRIDKINYDPHSWISIKNAKKYLNSIHDKLIEKYPENQKFYHKNKVKAVDTLTDLDAEYTEKFKHIENKNFLVVHYAYAYIARDFGLTQYPLQGLTSIESPSLKTIKKAVDFARDKNINTVFYEYGKPPKEAKALAEEFNGKTAPLASMEYITAEQKKDGFNYIDLMKMNLENLYESMQ